MSDEDDGSKSEEPSEKKIKDALDKGQTPVSREVAIVASLIVLTIFVSALARDVMVGLSGKLGKLWENAGTIRIQSGSDAATLSGGMAIDVSLALAAFLVMVIVGALISASIQAEPRMVIDRITPKFERISLAKGAKRLFGQQGLFDFAKQLAKLSVATAAVASVLAGAPEQMMQVMPLGPLSIGDTTRDLLVEMLTAILLAMVLVAVVDVIWTRFSWRKGLRMSLKEVKDEVKQSDGDPIVKARQQSVARDRARNRMMEAVPNATLVVANPIHVAVALRYDPTKDVAPVVVAKGQERLCWRIREIAEEAGVPVIENIPVARGLHKSVPLGALIPESFYVVVAELIKQLQTPHRA